MKKHSVILALLVSVLMISNSCTKKDTVVKLTENGCAKFKIFAASGAVLEDVTCDGTPLTASYDITFHYTGEIKCLKKIVLDPKFYKADNSTLSASFAPEILSEGNPQVRIDEAAKTCTFRFDFTFNNSTDANDFDHCFLVFHTENTEDQASKEAKVRLTGSCSQIVPYDPIPVKTIPVSSSTINLRLWDNAAEDGDIVTVYLNGIEVIPNHMLTNSGTNFILNVNPGSNHLVLIAMNEGSSGPNTCSLSVNGGSTTSLNLGLTTGQMIDIVF